MQDMHPLLPPKDFPVFNRKIITFKKLPIIRPRIKKIKINKKLITEKITDYKAGLID
jgi:hypothetical protein